MKLLKLIANECSGVVEIDGKVVQTFAGLEEKQFNKIVEEAKTEGAVVEFYTELGRFDKEGNYLTCGYVFDDGAEYVSVEEMESTYTKQEIEKMYCGFPLDSNPTKEELERGRDGSNSIVYYTEWEEVLDTMRNLQFRLEDDFQKFVKPLTKEECIQGAYKIAMLDNLILFITEAMEFDYELNLRNVDFANNMIADKNINLLEQLYNFYHGCTHPERYDIWGYEDGANAAVTLIEDFFKSF